MRKALLFFLSLIFAVALTTSAFPATLNVPGDYPTIQAAITAANPGDTINVAAGTYIENLVINKQLVLQGAGSASTIIDASGGTPGILLEAGGSSAATEDRQTIKDLKIINSTLDGIRAYKAGGLNLDYVTLENLISTLNGAKGVEIHNDVVVSDIEIKNCEFVNNSAQGLRTASNVTVDGMVITDSEFNQNTYGMYLQGTLNNITIRNTNMNSNSPGYGLYASETGTISNISIEDCQVDGNNWYGIVFWTPAGVDGITIRNTSIENSGRGFWIGAATISNVTIECSSVINNVRTSTTSTYEGMTFNHGTLTNVVVTNSNIYGNNARGIANYATGIVDATNNWWDADSGPYHSTMNSDGTGDEVTDNVTFSPWLAAPIGDPCPVPAYRCVGFKPPFDNKITLKNKNKRAIPVAMELFDSDGNPITCQDISAPPLVDVNYETNGSSIPGYDADLVPPGLSDDGNEFRCVDGMWLINLATRQFTAPGNYSVTVMAPAGADYVIAPSCTQVFERLN